MALSEGVSTRVVLKPYAVGTISANTQPTSSSDPGASGGQTLRRVACNLSLGKDTYQSQEIRSDRQIGDFRHGVKRVNRSISGELSPLTYEELFEASLRGTWAGDVVLGPSSLTSVAADNGASTFTVAAGDPVSLGLRVGNIIRLTDLSESANNGKNFLITAFGDSNNRTISVYPAPTTMTADTSFTLTLTGERVYAPPSSQVSRKFAVERYAEDVDIAELFTECRVTGFRLQAPPTGMATVEFPMLGRDLEIYSGGSAPFFTDPAAITSTGILAAVNGLILVNGTAQGVVTGLDMTLDLAATADPVVGQNFVPEIFLGRVNLTGQLTAFFENTTLIDNFIDEDEIALLLFLTASNDDDAAAMSFYLPRIKFGGADKPAQGEGGQTINLPFQALRYLGSTAGVEQTTIQIHDTEIS